MINLLLMVFELYSLFPLNEMVMVYFPFLFSFILTVAIPFLLVLAVYFLPLILKVILAPFIAFPFLVLSVALNFLFFDLTLNVFFLEVNFGVVFLKGEHWGSSPPTF